MPSARWAAIDRASFGLRFHLWHGCDRWAKTIEEIETTVPVMTRSDGGSAAAP